MTAASGRSTSSVRRASPSRVLSRLPRDPVAEPDELFTEAYCLDLVRVAIGDPTVPVVYLGHRLWQPTSSWAEMMSVGNGFLAGDAAHLTTPPVALA